MHIWCVMAWWVPELMGCEGDPSKFGIRTNVGLWQAAPVINLEYSCFCLSRVCSSETKYVALSSKIVLKSEEAACTSFEPL